MVDVFEAGDVHASKNLAQLEQIWQSELNRKAFQMHKPMKLLVCLGVLAAISADATEQVYSPSGATDWRLSADRARTGRPVQHSARDLFAPELRVTPEQLRVIAQMDAVEIKLGVKEMRAAEIITLIKNSLAATPASEVIIRADPSLASLEVRFTFAQSQIRLPDALWLLRMGDKVRYELRGNEVVAIPAGEAK